MVDTRSPFSCRQPSRDDAAATECGLPKLHQKITSPAADSGAKRVNSRGVCRARAARLPLLPALSLLGVIVALAAAADRASATWKPEYANAPQEVQDWYRSAQLTDAAQKRFGFKSCCAHSDVVKTEFRVDKSSGNDEWYWMKEGQWTVIPGDVIHWGESAPDQQPTLFAIGNLPTCFYPGQGGL